MAVGDLRSIEVGGPDKQWLLDPDEFPSQANKLAALMSVLPPPSRHFYFASISEREMREVTAECAESKPAAAKVPFAFCFEKKSGMLLDRVSPETRPLNVVVFFANMALSASSVITGFPARSSALKIATRPFLQTWSSFPLRPP